MFINHQIIVFFFIFRKKRALRTKYPNFNFSNLELNQIPNYLSPLKTNQKKKTNFNLSCNFIFCILWPLRGTKASVSHWYIFSFSFPHNILDCIAYLQALNCPINTKPVSLHLQLHFRPKDVFTSKPGAPSKVRLCSVGAVEVLAGG